MAYIHLRAGRQTVPAMRVTAFDSGMVSSDAGRERAILEMTDRFGAMTVLRPATQGAAVRRQVTDPLYSVEKDDPQPHVDLAFGFLMVNPPPVTVSTKSTSAFFRYWMLIGSTNSLTPCDSKT